MCKGFGGQKESKMSSAMLPPDVGGLLRCFRLTKETIELPKRRDNSPEETIDVYIK
jgi:hypothetical protein